jgi:mono/diheme cytochrome c family protein
VPALSNLAARRARGVARSTTLATAGLIGLLASCAPAQAPENPYPAASHTPTSQFGWERLSMKVERHAPRDEANGGTTPRGTPMKRRGEECFPTDERNLFAAVDMQPGPDGKLRSVFDQANASTVHGELELAIQGQNTWMLWGEGDEGFWGWLQEHNYGITDFLVLLDSRHRGTRFQDRGLTNQPEMVAQTDASKRILGLYLDQNATARAPWKESVPATCPAEAFTFTREPRYVAALSALATDDADPAIYGYPSGVVGLRLFPNPDFFSTTDAAAEARRHWKAQVEDSHDAYYRPGSPIAADPQLVRPFRVSMTCAFCHIGPHPLNPPDNPDEPEWKNLSSTIGAQYWTGPAAFANLKGPDSFFFQLVQSWQPGTLDTSLLSTDHINNPNAMYAIWDVPSRLERAQLNPPEAQSAANLLNPSIEDPFANPRHMPRALLDGSDSVGLFGALSRVYLNIGTYYEQWIRLQNPLIGFKAQRPFELATIRDKSVYWRVAEEQRVPELAKFFTYVNKAGETVTAPMKLADAPGGEAALATDSALAAKGRAVFIDNCAICHSSKQPDGFALAFSREWASAQPPRDAEPAHFVLPMDFADWEAFKRSKMYGEYRKRIVALAGVAPTASPDAFLEHNYLSTDIRIPVTLVGTNSSRAVGTNAMKGQVWADFSSDAYKSLPAVGAVHFYNPYSGKPTDEWGNNDVYYPPAGGPGYYRPASLVSVWATAPFLHNNALGWYTHDPSVVGRLNAFNDAADKLLWKAKRVPGEHDRPGDLRSTNKELAGHDPGFIYRTTQTSFIDIPDTFIRVLMVGVMGEGLTSFLTCYLWLGLAAVAIVLVWVGGQQLAGFTLLLFALVVGAMLRVTGIDTLYPSLWWISAVALAGALLFWLGPRSRGVTQLFFGLLAAIFVLGAAVAGDYVDGRHGGMRVGPIPQGTPVNLIMSLNPQAPLGDLVHAMSGMTRGLMRIRKERLSDADGAALHAFEAEAGLALLKVSKCPDFVLDRGHWFAEGLSDDQKRALKAFLKTL